MVLLVCRGWYCVGIVTLICVFRWFVLLLFVYGSSLFGFVMVLC